MTKERAANILLLQWAKVELDYEGRRKDYRARNYIEALKVAIDCLWENEEEDG